MTGAWMLGVGNNGRYICVMKVHVCVRAPPKAFMWMIVMWSMQAKHLIHHVLTQIPTAASLKGLTEKCFPLQLAACTEKPYCSSEWEIAMGVFDGFKASYHLNSPKGKNGLALCFRKAGNLLSKCKRLVHRLLWESSGEQLSLSWCFKEGIWDHSRNFWNIYVFLSLRNVRIWHILQTCTYTLLMKNFRTNKIFQNHPFCGMLTYTECKTMILWKFHWHTFGLTYI